MLSWDDMSMDERMRDTGYDLNDFDDIDYDDYVYPEHAAMEPGYYTPDWDVIKLELAEFEADEKAWRAEEEAEEEAQTERLEMLDPHCEPRMWRTRQNFTFNGELILMPGSGKVIAEKDPWRRRGERFGAKPRERNRDRRREREIWRNQMLTD